MSVSQCLHSSACRRPDRELRDVLLRCNNLPSGRLYLNDLGQNAHRDLFQQPGMQVKAGGSANPAHSIRRNSGSSQKLQPFVTLGVR